MRIRPPPGTSIGSTAAVATSAARSPAASAPGSWESRVRVVMGGPTILSVDPSAGRHPVAQLALALVVEDAAIPLDDGLRRDVVGIAGDEGGIDPELVRNAEGRAQHLGRVASATGRRADVVADVAADLEEGRGQPMPDPDPPEELVAIEPPQLGRRYPPVGARGGLERLGSDVRTEALERVGGRPFPRVIAQVAADDAVVGGRPAPLRSELGHRGGERRTHTSDRREQPGHGAIIRHPWARSSMAEQLTLNQRVEGSSPSGLTIPRGK